MKPRIRQTALMAGLALLLGALLSAPAWAAVSFDDVVRMKSAGVSEDTILKLVDAEGAAFTLGVDEIIALKEAGASESFIRSLLDATQGAGYESPTNPPQYDGSMSDQYNAGVSDMNGTNDLSDYSTVFTYHYYDPFAYYWYPWPDYYIYYSPFWWSNAGFYYGGFWSWDWWQPWGASSFFCDDHFGFRHRFGRSHTWDRDDHRDWDRPSSDFGDRATRERTIWRRAGFDRPPELNARPNPTWTDAERVRTRGLVTPSPDRNQPTYRTYGRDRVRQGQGVPPAMGRPGGRGRDQGQPGRYPDRTVRRDGERARQAPPSRGEGDYRREPAQAPRGGWSAPSGGEREHESGRSGGGERASSGRPGRGR
jgi:hypothetical protein